MDNPEPTNLPKLTAKKERFCREYVIDHNATQAALRAGYSPKTAHSQGQRLLKKAESAALIAQLEAEVNARLEISAENVRKRLWAIATADVGQFMEYRRTCCRYCHGDGFRYLRTPAEHEAAMELFQSKREKAIADEEEFVHTFDHKGGIGWDANKPPHPDCPECFGEGHGRAFFHDTRFLPEELKAVFDGVKITERGIEFKLKSGEKALELIARHLGMFTDKLELTGDGGGPVQFEQFLAKIYGDKE